MSNYIGTSDEALDFLRSIHVRDRLILELTDAARCALADLEGVAPEVDPSGDRQHPIWQTIGELRTVINKVSGEKA